MFTSSSSFKFTLFAGMSTVDTSSYKLTLFAALSKSAAQVALQQGMIKPEIFMESTEERDWIPMNKSVQAALRRGHWGADERGEEDLHPKNDFTSSSQFTDSAITIWRTFSPPKIGKHGVSMAPSME